MPRLPQNKAAGGSTGGKPRWLTPTLWIAALAVLGTLLFFPAALATDRPTFCRTCHEMVPYYDAWRVGQHAKTAECIDCHVDAGLPARFAHKFVALGEVKSHFAGDTAFPRSTPPEVPNKRCTRCHPTLPKTTPEGFSHQIHAQKGTCATCHAATGHDVATATLEAAGVFNAGFTPAARTGKFATLDGGKANVKDHKTVICSRCHDMAETGCPRCHTAKVTQKHPWKTGCAECHTAGDKFAFRHPVSTDCAKCHGFSASHFKPISGKLAECASCHPSAGKAWTFIHPASPGDCAACHQPPANHFPGPCLQCHDSGGGSWKFSHPASGADCAGCHKPPTNHYTGRWSSCHPSAGSTWKFSHPSAGEHSWTSEPCAACHPTSFSAVSCTCHGGNPPGD